MFCGQWLLYSHVWSSTVDKALWYGSNEGDFASLKKISTYPGDGKAAFGNINELNTKHHF